MQLRTAIPWLLLTLLFGVSAGFAVGQATTRTPVGAEETTVPEAGPSMPDGAAVAVPPTPEVARSPAVSSLPCWGGPASGGAYVAVIGVEDVGAEDIASQLDVDPITRPFAELNSQRAQDEVREAALEKAGLGPVVLVLQLSEGPYQRRLAREVLDESPESVVLVVTDAARPDEGSLRDFPPGSVAVPPPGAAPGGLEEGWIAAVLDIVTGQAICPGG